ncbi:QacE family quaternary ammonium compound efflux SMR transporter [Kitasatospora xanthocidica]|uniref:DMT family transporter n=1 Tax=Kitasatospora xanthocidica TaxID=83382 RepID=UPI0016743253|nr:multidrug efflux SMR transporter [Kitasatospora xanthocidica]GHF62047.1 QacE family quaternary ammonium compound efflux SMR transporter [Kitasatospora xanthocidica]
MPWLLLLAAGLVEVVWSQSIKPTDGFTRPGPTALCVLLGALSVYLLSRAMRDLPAGLSYALFTGIGTVGAITLGTVLRHEPLGLGRLAALLLIVAGLVLARLTASD